MGLLDGRVAIITGSGRGIGAATAKLFAEHGARVVVTDIDPEPAEETVNTIQEAGGQALAVPGDVTDPAYPEHLITTALDTFGGLDVLVNNAGYTWDSTVHKMTDEQWCAMIDVHLTAPFRIIRAAAPYLRETAKREKAERGAATSRKIINISSIAGTRGNAGQMNYASAKAGVIGLTKTLAREWAQFNIQVNCVVFGYIETRLTQEKERGETIRRGDREVPIGVPATLRGVFTMLIPLGRPGTVEEAAGPVLFFASPLADYVSGQVLEVSGGY